MVGTKHLYLNSERFEVVAPKHVHLNSGAVRNGGTKRLRLNSERFEVVGNCYGAGLLT